MIESRLAASGMFKSSYMAASGFHPSMSSYVPEQARSTVGFASSGLDIERVKAIGRHFYQMYGRGGTLGSQSVQQVQLEAHKGRAIEQSQATIQDLARIMDADSDGVISERDCENLALRYILGLQERPVAQPVYTKVVQERLNVARRLFKKFDSDGSGFLTEDEIPCLLEETYRIMGQKDYQASAEDVRSWMEMTNKSRTGKVTLQEYEESIIKSLKNAGIKIYDE
jgi:Ca2+-binding EF-hand superfamily protein